MSTPVPIAAATSGGALACWAALVTTLSDGFGWLAGPGLARTSLDVIKPAESNNSSGGQPNPVKPPKATPLATSKPLLSACKTRDRRLPLDSGQQHPVHGGKRCFGYKRAALSLTISTAGG
jgi:predicted O-methyltransferase YrrM